MDSLQSPGTRTQSAASWQLQGDREVVREGGGEGGGEGRGGEGITLTVVSSLRLYVDADSRAINTGGIEARECQAGTVASSHLLLKVPITIKRLQKKEGKKKL